jgi:tetratricopeptide (TPR) repeat protein
MYNKGVSLRDLGQYEEAIGYFDKVLVIDPNNVVALEYKQFATDNLG